MSPIPTFVHRVNLPGAGFAAIVAPVGRERSHHWFRSGSKAGMPAMTRRKQGLTRRDGGRSIYWQTLDVTRDWLIAERRRFGGVEGSGGGIGRFAAWLLKQGSGASASGPCWFCGALSDRRLEPAASCSRPGKRLYRRSALPSSSGPGRCPLTAETGVRFP